MLGAEGEDDCAKGMIDESGDNSTKETTVVNKSPGSCTEKQTSLSASFILSPQPFASLLHIRRIGEIIKSHLRHHSLPQNQPQQPPIHNLWLQTH